MSDLFSLRSVTLADLPALRDLYRAAFPEEDLVPLVMALAEEPSACGWVVKAGGRLAGHVGFTLCGLDGAACEAALLAPLAVAPDFQKQGLGRRLVEMGLAAMKDKGAGLVLVLGDPGYYGRFGFQEETQVMAPYTLPADWAPAWQSIRFDSLPEKPLCLLVPAPWQDPALWG